MAGITFVAIAPLGTAAVWSLLAVYQTHRERYRTWTEVFFLAACVSVGAYAISDILFFTTGDAAGARTAAVASLTALTFTALFFMMYGVVLHTRFRWSLFLSLIPIGLLLVLIPTAVLTPRGVTSPVGDIGIPYLPDYDMTWFEVWAAVLLVLDLMALWGIYRTFREVRRQSASLGRRLLMVIVSFVVAITLSLFTNTASSFLKLNFPPLLSTALVLPGIFMFIAMSPLSDQSLTDILRRWKARDYQVQGAFLLFKDGTLIDSELAPGQDMIDRDVFGATLDVIQNFMRTSFPALRGKWLQSIRHGDFTLVVEHGQWTSVAVVLKGEENDQLRRHIRDLISAFEAENRTALMHWRGTASDASGLGALLGDLVQ